MRLENTSSSRLDDIIDFFNCFFKLQLAVVIFPTIRDDRYSAVKSLCTANHPIPSQMINCRTISNPGKLRSIVQKIALQINCKMGGELWAVHIPTKTMVADFP